MRRIFLVVLVLIVVPVFSFAASLYKTTRDNINIRSDSTIQADSIGFLAKDDVVEVLDEKFDWCKIVLPREFSCFVFEGLSEKIDSQRIKITASKVNIRSAPSLKSHILGNTTEGTELILRKESGQWFEVDAYPQAKGWVHKLFLEEIKEPELNKNPVQIEIPEIKALE